MRGKKLLVAFLLGVGLCFVPVLGHGGIPKETANKLIEYMEFFLLEAKVSYIMANPTDFLDVGLFYDRFGMWWRTGHLQIPGTRRTNYLPENVRPEGKICVETRDNRGVFVGKSRIALLNEFKKQSQLIYWYIKPMATNKDTDLVGVFSIARLPLGYFYQGEYHLWGE